ILIFVGFVFALAGLIKGVIGLGLPTISMGLLAVVMPPVHAAAILILPSLVTNVWRMVAGAALSRASSAVADDARRLPRHLGGPRAHDDCKRPLWHGAAGYCIGSICGDGTCSAPAVRSQTVGAGIFAGRWRHHGIDHGCHGRLRHPRSSLPASHRVGEG